MGIGNEAAGAAFASIRGRIADASLLTLLATATLFGAARIGLTPRDPHAGVAVIFAPWTQAEAALDKATATGGRFIRFGALPFIAVIMPDDDAYADRMLAAGAWLVVDPKALDACLGSIPAHRT